MTTYKKPFYTDLIGRMKEELGTTADKYEFTLDHESPKAGLHITRKDGQRIFSINFSETSWHTAHGNCALMEAYKKYNTNTRYDYAISDGGAKMNII